MSLPPITEGGKDWASQEARPWGASGPRQDAWKLGYAAMEKRHHEFLRHLIDAEKFDARYGVNLPGDSALAVLINSAMETLDRDA